MTRIYTKTGDAGETGLFGGGRVPKDHVRVEAYGVIDELNAAIGLAVSLDLPADLGPMLSAIQDQLFTVGAALATPEESKADAHIPHVQNEWIEDMEERLDAFEKELPALGNFILPGGSQGASALHLARTVCRRAERRVAPLLRHKQVAPPVLVYLNRLSDLLFSSARMANLRAGVKDVIWKAPTPESAG